MVWIKVPAEHRPVFEAALPRDPRVQTRQMFGGVAASINGNMFGGLFARSAIVRVYGADHAEALALPGASPFDPMGNGRVSKDTVMLPEDVFHDDEALREWLRRACEGAAKLPRKVKKTAKTAAPAKAKAKPAARANKPAPTRKAVATKRPATRPAANKTKPRRR
jgi:TfoX/Sxy family transcriptional regulator of competence genes